MVKKKIQKMRKKKKIVKGDQDLKNKQNKKKISRLESEDEINT